MSNMIPQLPLMSYEHINYICSRFKNKPSGAMFEYGCGGSTMLFSRYVEFYRSVEHVKEWYDYMKDEVPRNVQLFLKEPLGEAIHPFGPSNIPQQQEYINCIHMDNLIYDYILIDGRCRVECARQAVLHMNKDSQLYVHDYERIKYHTIENFLKLKEKLIYPGDNRVLACFSLQ
jgi:hypothetical protein